MENMPSAEGRTVKRIPIKIVRPISAYSHLDPRLGSNLKPNRYGYRGSILEEKRIAMSNDFFTHPDGEKEKESSTSIGSPSENSSRDDHGKEAISTPAHLGYYGEADRHVQSANSPWDSSDDKRADSCGESGYQDFSRPSSGYDLNVHSPYEDRVNPPQPPHADNGSILHIAQREVEQSSHESVNFADAISSHENAYDQSHPSPQSSAYVYADQYRADSYADHSRSSQQSHLSSGYEQSSHSSYQAVSPTIDLYQPDSDQLASWGMRMKAGLIDYGIPYLIFTIPSHFLLEEGSALSLLLKMLNLCWYIYNVIYLTGRSGQSWGKKIAGIRLISNTTGNQPSYAMVFVRQIAHFVDTLVLFLGFFLPLVDEKRQTIADKMCGTYVVTVPEK